MLNYQNDHNNAFEQIIIDTANICWLIIISLQIFELFVGVFVKSTNNDGEDSPQWSVISRWFQWHKEGITHITDTKTSSLILSSNYCCPFAQTIPHWLIAVVWNLNGYNSYFWLISEDLLFTLKVRICLYCLTLSHCCGDLVN